MDSAFRQFPDQPGLYCTKQQFPPLSPLSGAFYMIQYPFDLCCGEICINDQARFFTVSFRQSFLFQKITVFRSSAALPYNCVTDWSSCCFIPYNCRFTLIRDTNRRNVRCSRIDVFHRLYRNLQLRRPYFIRIMLHPPRFREILCKFFLRNTAHFSLLIK